MWANAFASIDLLFICTVYFVGVASPGPANLAIMVTAMQTGRKQATLLAVGIECGSLIWGVLAGFGLAAVMATYSEFLIIMKILAGIYLLWLAYKTARSALSKGDDIKSNLEICESDGLKYFSRGVFLHLTNPKAIFVWLSIISIGIPAGATTTSIFIVVLYCSIISTIVFVGYALLFSTKIARNMYFKIRRGFDAVMCMCFGYAGLKLLIGKSGAQSP